MPTSGRRRDPRDPERRSARATSRTGSIDVDGAELRIIAVEDLIVDRLASWKHWGWDPDGAAAVVLLGIHEDLDDTRLARRADDEDVRDALEALRPLARGDSPVSGDTLRRIRSSL